VGSWLVEDCEDKKLQQSDLSEYYDNRNLQIKKYFIIQENN
jgi:hypothetical protein